MTVKIKEKSKPTQEQIDKADAKINRKKVIIGKKKATAKQKNKASAETPQKEAKE